MDCLEIEFEKKVKTIYPDAICYCSIGGCLWRWWEFCIVRGPKEVCKPYNENNKYSMWCPTKGKAWTNAWKTIEIKMLAKLEG